MLGGKKAIAALVGLVLIGGCTTSVYFRIVRPFRQKMQAMVDEVDILTYSSSSYC